jgi:hypothetical protein
MATIREQIISAMQTLLSAASGASGPPAPASLTVHRERTRPIEADALPAILIYFEDDAPEPISSKVGAPLTLRAMTVCVECRAAGSVAISPDQALDPLIAWTLYQVFQNERFGGLANEAIEGKTVWNSKEGEVALASATLHITIKYRTSRIDPTSKS